MTIDNETRKIIDRIVPADPAPPDDTFVATHNALVDAQNRYDELAAAVVRCDHDIDALQSEQAALRVLEQNRSKLHADAYVVAKKADTRELDKAIATAKANIETLRAKADGAIAARAELVALLTSQRRVVDDLQSSVIQQRAAGGMPLPPTELGKFTRDYQQRVDEQMAARRAQAKPQELDAEREAARRNADMAERQQRNFLSRFLRI